MGILQRIKDLFRMIANIFVEGAEDSVPLERRLAYDRQKRADSLRKQMGAAEDVGAAAEMMVQQLAEGRIIAANVRQEAKAHLQAAQSAANRGDEVTRQQEEARASALAEELAAAEGDVEMLEQMVSEALSDKKEAIAMVLDQAKQLESLARGDSRLVARARMSDMRRQQMQLREQMMELVPGDQSNIRARIQESVVRDEAKVRARRDVVDALWEQKQRSGMDRALATTAAGAAKLDELKSEIGYTGAAPAAPAPAEEEADQTSAAGSTTAS